MRKKKSAPRIKDIPSKSAEIRVDPCLNVFREQLLQAIRNEDPGRVIALAIEEARRIDKEEIFWILRHLAQVAPPAFVDWGDKKVSSASIIRMGSRYSVKFNPGFLYRYVKTPQDLLHLVLHELLHKVRGDLRRPALGGDRTGILDFYHEFICNVTADLLVNALLKRCFFPESAPMQDLLYRDRDLWLSLLYPPDFLIGPGKIPEEGMPEIRRHFRRPLEKVFAGQGEELGERFLTRAIKIYIEGWSGKPSYALLGSKILDLFMEILKADPSIRETLDFDDLVPLLLGRHPCYEANEEDPWWDWFREEFGKYFKGPGGHLERVKEEETEVEEIQAWEFYEAVRRAIVNDPMNPTFNVSILPEIGVLPFLGRRELFLYQGGYRPVLYPNPLPLRDWSDHKVQLYIDVSGSTKELWPFLYGMALQLRDEIGEPFYVFSNKVEAIGLKELKEGHILSTYGTDFDCIFQHAREHRFSRILVVTDGYAELKEENRKGNHLEVFVVLTEDYPDCPLIDVAGRNRENEKWWVIDWGKIKQALCL